MSSESPQPSRMERYKRYAAEFNARELFAVKPGFAQFGEDRFVADFFRWKPEGFFVDVGGYDPIRFSNTYLLYKRGWSGITLEPDPDGSARFRRFRPRDINLQIGAGSKPGTFDFVRAGLCSGIDTDEYRYSEQPDDVERIDVEVRRLDDVFEEHLPEGQHIDYISIDCEGNDIDVVASNDWNRFRPTLCLVEDCIPKEEPPASSPLHGVMEEHGYHYYTRLGLTNVYLAEEVASDYIPSLRSTKVVVA